MVGQSWDNMLSRASEMGSPTNHRDSRQRRDIGQGSSKMEKYGPTTGPVLLRQGEPGTSQYIKKTETCKKEQEIIREHLCHAPSH